MATHIKLDHIHKKYGRGSKATEVLKAVNLTIEPGELFFLLGPSGCGKTTLLRIVAGLIEPTDGRVFFNQTDITQTPIEKRDTAMVFQNYALWPHMTVTQNVEFGPRMHHVEVSRRKQIGIEKLALVEMDSYCNRKPNQLSGGQQQRVALARALAAEPACLLLDEPLSNLDAKLRMQMRTELRKLIKASDTTAIYVTHDQKEALSMADRIAILHEGQIVQVDTPEMIYNQPANSFVADFVGEANFIEGRVVSNQSTQQIETAIGTLLSHSHRTFNNGDNVICSIRPECISLAAKNNSTTNQHINLISARMDHLVYLGEVSQVGLQLANGVIWKMTTLNKPELKSSEMLTLVIRPEDVVLLRQ
jgi:iron(III) transport system ATP-binding protein